MDPPFLREQGQQQKAPIQMLFHLIAMSGFLCARFHFHEKRSYLNYAERAGRSACYGYFIGAATAIWLRLYMKTR